MPLLQSEIPIELAEHIACELDTVQDVLSFSLVCHHFHAAVNCDQSVYRSLFLRVYERPRKSEGYDYKTAFQDRHSKIFDEGVLRDIILGTPPTVHEERERFNADKSYHTHVDARPLRTLDASPFPIATSPNLDHLAKIFADRSPPPALRSLLYPLQFLSLTSPLFPMHDNTSSNWTRSIAQDYRSNTAKIADTFAQHLHPSNRNNSFLRRGLALLQPSELPSFWEGDLISQETVVPTRWFGAYLYLPMVYNIRAGPLELAMMDITLSFSTPSSFSASGHDIAPYTMRQGKIQGDGDQRHVSWIKDYGTHRWIYQGMLEGGGQRIVGVWGQGGINGLFNPLGTQGLFMLWAVPDDSVSLGSRR